MLAESHRTILTVEDELRIRESIVAYFEDLGYNVLEATDGADGLAKFRENKPDILLTDLRMPVMNGLELINELRDDFPDTPIIVVSGTGSIGDAIEAMRAGAWDYVTKPIEDMALLGHVVDQVLDRARLIEENRRYQEHLEEQVKERTHDLREANKALAEEIEERKRAEQARLVQLRFLEDMEKIDRAIRESETLKDMVFNVLDVARSVFKCGKAWLLNPCDPAKEQYRFSANPGEASVITCSVSDKMSQVMADALKAEGIYFESFTGKVDDCAVFGCCESHSLMAIVIQPRASEPWLMGLQDYPCDREWAQDERRLFTEIGHRMAEALSAFIFLRDLHKSEKRFKDLVGNIPGVVFRCGNDLNWSMLYISDYVETITGYPPSGFIDNCTRAYSSIIADEDRNTVGETIRGAIKKGEPYGIEYRIHDSENQMHWVYEKGQGAIGKDGKLKYVDGILFDITDLKKAAEELDNYRNNLEDIIQARTLELEKIHEELLEVSHRAGMSEIATGVLHNVGNVLNSVNVSATIIDDRLRESKVDKLIQAMDLVQENAEDLAYFVTEHPQGKHLVAFLSELGKQLIVEREGISDELRSLIKNIEHVKKVINTQQSYARSSGATELVSSLAALLDDAIQINTASFQRHHINVVRDYGDVPPAVVDKHKIVQILVNLVGNAKNALLTSEVENPQLTLRLNMAGENSIRIEVIDNGIGIAQENLVRIFSHGFTTKKGGHGFGLHSSACAAKEMGGTLAAHSDGPGKGAAFVLEFPYVPSTKRPSDSKARDAITAK